MTEMMSHYLNPLTETVFFSAGCVVTHSVVCTLCSVPGYAHLCQRRPMANKNSRTAGLKNSSAVTFRVDFLFFVLQNLKIALTNLMHCSL